MELVTLSGMRVKTDITVYSGGRIPFGSHIPQPLGMCGGDGVALVRHGGALVLCVLPQPHPQEHGHPP